MAGIKMKAADFTGQIGSVVFSKGKGETDNEGMLAYFRKRPDVFEVEADEPEAPTLTPKQALQAELEALGLPTDGKMDELKARLEAAKAEPVKDEAPKDDEGSKDAGDGDQGDLSGDPVSGDGEAD